MFEPAIALARDGFPISPRLAQMLAEADPQSFAPAARAYFFDAQGRPWPVGYKLANPALADTFATIARDGAKAFYQGDIAKDIASAVQNDPRKPGKLAAEDIASYRAIEREPICAPYRALQGLRHGPVVLRRRYRGAGARYRRAVQSRPCHRSARAPCMSSPKRSGSLSPTARVTSPIRISFPSLSPGCSTRPTLPDVAP